MSALTMSANCASLWPSETHVKSGRLFEIFALLGMAFRSTRELSKNFDSKTLLGMGLRALVAFSKIIDSKTLLGMGLRRSRGGHRRIHVVNS